MNGTANGAVKPAPAAFDAAIKTVLGAATRTADERGQEYGDSWALDTQHTPFQDLTHRVIDDRNGQAMSWAQMVREERRLCTVAGLCDVKLSRMLGGYKADTLDDLINYVAALRAWLSDYRGESPGSTPA